MKLLTYLRSNQFAITIAILSVLVQSFHSFTAFYNTSALKGAWGIAQAVLFAIVIDLAILFYTVRRRRDIALYAAVAMVTINAYYYYQHLGITFEFIFGCFLSLIIPVSVYFYSEEIKEDETASSLLDQVANLTARNSLLAGELDKVKKMNKETDEHLGRRLDDIDRLERELATIKLKGTDKTLVNVSDPPELEPDKVEDSELLGQRVPTQQAPIRISRTGGDKNDKA